jgi:hypothetical protein
MPSDFPRRPGCLLLHALQGALVGVALALALHFGYVLLGTNFRTILPGQAYRCGQFSPARLEHLVRRHGIRTVINLRGCCMTAKWYRAQTDAVARLDIVQEDLSFSATRMPSTTAVRLLVEVIERSEYPILFHCHQGADRTGLASVIFLLLRTNATLPEAMKQFGPSSGHVPLGRTAHIDRFFVLYRRWLGETCQEHSPAAFRLWATEHYCPEGARAKFELLSPSPRCGRGDRGVRGTGQGCIRIHEGSATRVTVRCHNTSRADWRFEPGLTAGTHGQWWLIDHDERFAHMGRTGLRKAVVEPGGRIDLDFVLPPLPAGRYTLHFDLIEERHASFMQVGNRLLSVRVEVSP